MSVTEDDIQQLTAALTNCQNALVEREREYYIPLRKMTATVVSTGVNAMVEWEADMEKRATYVESIKHMKAELNRVMTLLNGEGEMSPARKSEIESKLQQLEAAILTTYGDNRPMQMTNDRYEEKKRLKSILAKHADIEELMEQRDGYKKRIEETLKTITDIEQRLIRTKNKLLTSFSDQRTLVPKEIMATCDELIHRQAICRIKMWLAYAKGEQTQTKKKRDKLKYLTLLELQRQDIRKRGLAIARLQTCENVLASTENDVNRLERLQELDPASQWLSNKREILARKLEVTTIKYNALQDASSKFDNSDILQVLRECSRVNYGAVSTFIKQHESMFPTNLKPTVRDRLVHRLRRSRRRRRRPPPRRRGAPGPPPPVVLQSAPRGNVQPDGESDDAPPPFVLQSAPRGNVQPGGESDDAHSSDGNESDDAEGDASNISLRF